MNKYKVVLYEQDDLYVFADDYSTLDDVTNFFMQGDAGSVATVLNRHLVYVKQVDIVDASKFMCEVYKATVRLSLMNVITDKVSDETLDILVEKRIRGLTADDLYSAFRIMQSIK